MRVACGADPCSEGKSGSHGTQRGKEGEHKCREVENESENEFGVIAFMCLGF